MKNGITKKKCRACLEEKELCEFGTNSSYKDGLQAKCRKCYRLKKPLDERDDLIGEVKKCEVCLEEKDLFYFYKRLDRSHTHRPRCIQCTKEGKLIDKKIIIGSRKKCPSCNIYKDFDSYHKCSSCLKGISSSCKDCRNMKKKNERDNTPLDIRKKKKREEYLKNREGYLIRAKEYAKNNKEHVLEYKRKYDRNTKNERPLLHLTGNIRALIRSTFVRSIVGEIIKAKKTDEILGCDFKCFKQHIERQFLYWMSWDNYGNVCGTELEYNCSWDLDHCVPISSAKTEDEVYLLNHWSNFQPLCSKVNREDKRDILFPLTNLELNITITEDEQIIHND